MKKNFILLLVAVVVVGGSIFGILSFKSKNVEKDLPGMKERTGQLKNLSEWNLTSRQAGMLMTKIKNDRTDIKSQLSLASIMINEGRITGDHAYYDDAAMFYIDEVLAKDPSNFEALLYKATVQLSQHDFAKAIETADKARNINPYNAFVYGILVDGYVEMGEYDSAVVNSDRMISIRPDLRSYSRISYLREIHGDIPGAIEAMKMAVDAGSPGDESTEWSRVQLGKLYEQHNDLQNASMQYEIALNERPGFAHALAAKGFLYQHQNQPDSAMKYINEAAVNNSDHGFVENVAEIHEMQGNKEKALEGYKNLKASLEKEPNTNLEMADLYLKLGDTKKAVECAKKEYERRPKNFEVNEMMAWTLYKNGEVEKAANYLEAALKTNCQEKELQDRIAEIRKAFKSSGAGKQSAQH
ncbi:MAG: tetratricopeptide repeat protein [Flavitalea sp.]